MKKSLTPLNLFLTVAGLVAPINILAAPGDLYEADSASGMIFKFAPDGTKTLFASGLNAPQGLAFDASGNLFEADAGSGTIFKFTPAGAKSTFAAGLRSPGGPGGLAFDGAGNLFETAFFGDRILKFAPDGTMSVFASGLNAPVAPAFDRAGNLFEADFFSNTISKFTPDGTMSNFATGLQDPTALAFDSSGNLYEADNDTFTIFKFAPNGTRSTFAASGLNDPVALAFDGSGNLFEADNNGGTIFKFTPGGMISVFASGLNGPAGLAFEPITPQLRNISTRGFVGTGDNVLIGGFIIGGNGGGTDMVLVRALGRSLTAMGVAGALQDPMLRLFDGSGMVIASNDNWKSAQQAQIQATGLAPTDDSESAIIASLPAGSFTAIVTGVNDTTGVALMDIFDLAAQPATQTLRNISTRGFVGTGDNVLVAGLVVGGNALATNSVLVRALGPSLGVAGALQDPMLRLFDGSGMVIASNDNWKDTQQAQIQATGTSPPDASESAIIISLPAGSYTAIVSGVNNTTGVALVDVFNLH